MRILHTSDWHLGRQFMQVSLEEDHDAILAQVEAAVAAHSPDLLIIAGDLFDRPMAPQTAMNRLRDFLRRVTASSPLAIAIIAGNHDAAAQIGMLGVLAGERTLVRGPLDKDDTPLLLADEHGAVAVSALPFSYEFAARECFGDESINCPADVLRAQIQAARSRVPDGARWVVIAHTFVDGAVTSEAERPLTRTVGGIETVPASTFAGAHYVALGHLHRPQAIGADHVRYSGAPIAFGFDEEGHEKSMTLVDLHANGTISFELLPFQPVRKVQTVRGRLQELLAAPEKNGDLIRVILTDETTQIDAMKRVREVFPNAVQLLYERDQKSIEQLLQDGAAKIDDPETLVAEFLQVVRERPPSAREGSIIAELVHELRGGPEV